MSKIKLFECFSGYGSQSLEATELGIDYELVGTSEVDPNAIIAYGALRGINGKPVGYTDINLDTMKSYLKDKNIGLNYKTGKQIVDRMKKEKVEMLYRSAVNQNCLGDVSIIKTNDIPDMDLFTYSFPCQDISLSGLQKGFNENSNTRSSLLWECKKIIESKKPKALMMENVKALVNKKNIGNFNKWLSWLKSQGYRNYRKVINSRDCGIPQNRERVFCVSILESVIGNHNGDEFNFDVNDINITQVSLEDILEKNIDEKYYLDDSKVEEYIERYLDKHGEVPHKKNDNEIEGLYPIAIRGRYVDSKTKQMVEMNHSNFMNTLTTVQKDSCLLERSVAGGYNYRIRYLTPIEYLRLMGLNEEEVGKIIRMDFSDSQMYKLAGNSIVKQSMWFLKKLCEIIG